MTEQTEDCGELHRLGIERKPKGGTMAKKKKQADVGHNSGEVILRFVERLERLETEKEALNDDVKQVKAEVKAEGFDATIIADLVKIRRNEAKHKERLQLLSTYAASIQLDLFSAAA